MSVFGMCAVTHSLDRDKYVDFSHFTYYDMLTFMTMKPDLKSREWLVVYPFSKPLWMIIGSSCLVVAVSIYWLWKYSVQTPQNQDSFYRIFTVLYKIMLVQCEFTLLCTNWDLS